jgi:heme/copper-type cytochrome/quinol oxidase subunit 2
METLMILMYIVFFLIALILSFASVKYFIIMWKFKNRKKDGSEDDDFKRFD